VVKNFDNNAVNNTVNNAKNLSNWRKMSVDTTRNYAHG